MFETPMAVTQTIARIDVLMPAYNAETTIEDSIRSILNQSFTDFRLVVVNDGSTDGTGAVLAKLAALDPRILVLEQENLGIVAALNCGLAECQGEYVARFDADDLAFPKRLERQVEYLDRNQGCVAVSCLVWHIDISGNRLGSIAGHMPQGIPNPAAVPSKEPYLMHPFVMIRRNPLISIGGYRHLELSEDTDLYWRLLEIGKLFVLDEILGEYRFHPASLSSSSVLNGRIAALNSQLAAVSARRRRDGSSDIEFFSTDIENWRRAKSLEAMLHGIAPRLIPDEITYLRLSTVVKLLELNSYRPYELEVSDCRFINRVLVEDVSKISENHLAKRLWAGSCARLISVGRLREASEIFHGTIALGVFRRLLMLTIFKLLPRKSLSALRKLKAQNRVASIQ